MFYRRECSRCCSASYLPWVRRGQRQCIIQMDGFTRGLLSFQDGLTSSCQNHTGQHQIHEESLNCLQKESMCVYGGRLATHYSAKDSSCSDYHLLDQHLSSPTENAVCSMQLLSEGHLYSPPHSELSLTELEKCGQWFCAGNVSLLSLNHRNPLPCLLTGKNTNIFLGKDFHWRGMITS